MSASGKLIRSYTGRLQRTADGRLRKCDCDNCDDCKTVIAAHPCKLYQDEACERLNLYGHKWVCADAICEGGDTPVGKMGSLVFAAGDGFCYFTDPEDRRGIGEIEPGDIVFDGPLNCVGTCDSAECESDYEYDQCQCICHATGVNQDNFCCCGKFYTDGEGTPGSPANPYKVCFDFTYEKRYQIDIQRTGSDPGHICPYYDVTDCIAGASCVVFRVIEQHSDPAGYEACAEGCIRAKCLRQQELIDKHGPDPNGCTAINHIGCSAPDVADPTVYVYCDCEGSSCFDCPLCFGCPTKGPEINVVDDSWDDPEHDPYYRFKTTTHQTNTCDQTHVVYTEEEWRYCHVTRDDGTPFPESCSCVQYYKYTEETTVNFQRQDDPECDYCKFSLVNPPDPEP